MNRIRIGIIGGSIAGLECALRLAEKQEVVLFEEHEKIGEPLLCGEGWARAFLEPYGFVERVVERALVRWIDERMEPKRSVEVRFNGSVVIIDRTSMEKHMAKLAVEKGCKIYTGKRVKISELINNFDVIIDASGHPSQYEREFGQPKKEGLAVQARCEYSGEEFIVDFYKKLDGYFWIFPKTNGLANIGVGYIKRKPASSLRALLDKYLDSIDAKPLYYIAAPLGIGLKRPFVRYVGGKPIALVGDAAGMVDKFAGEGMTKAVFAARILSACLNREGIGGLKNYEKIYMKKMSRFYRISEILYRFKNSPLAYPAVKLVAPLFSSFLIPYLAKGYKNEI